MHNENKLDFLEHLGELRKRLLISIIVVCVAFFVCFSYSDRLLWLLTFPLNYQLNLFSKPPFLQFLKVASNNKLYFTAPAEAFWVHLKIAMVFAVIFSSPVIIAQIWLFIKPALFQDEEKTAAPFVMSSVALFLIGAVFCFAVVLPFAINFLLAYKTQELVPMLTIENYVDFTLKFILAFGAVFQLPILMVLLTKLNIITTKTLKENRKYAVLLIFIAAAILTPTPDIFNQFIMAVPMLLLYEIGIILSSALQKKEASE